MKLFADNGDGLPQTIIYSTNPNDLMELATGIQSFQGDGIQKLRLGCACWFNDTCEDIKEHLGIVAQQSLLGNFGAC